MRDVVFEDNGGFVLTPEFVAEAFDGCDLSEAQALAAVRELVEAGLLAVSDAGVLVPTSVGLA